MNNCIPAKFPLQNENNGKVFYYAYVCYFAHYYLS
jgi:hypothetical protein